MISSSDSSRTSSPAMRRAAERKTLGKPSAISVVPVKPKPALRRDPKILLSDSTIKKEPVNKSYGVTRAESPMMKPKSAEARPVPTKHPFLRARRSNLSGKVETGSQDSVATEASVASTKSPLPSKRTSIQSKSTPVPQVPKRTVRSVEGSTAASRSRAAAVAGSCQVSSNLRKSLLDAAKAPEIQVNRLFGSPAIMRSSLRQPKSSVSDKKSQPTKILAKSMGPPAPPRQRSGNKLKELAKPSKVKPNVEQNAPKFLSQTSRSGTFLKDEPTILNKSDMYKVSIYLQPV